MPIARQRLSQTSRKATTWALQVATSSVLGTGSRCAFVMCKSTGTKRPCIGSLQDRNIQTPPSSCLHNSNNKCCPTSRSTSLPRHHSRNLPVSSFCATSLSKAFSPRMQTKRATTPRRLSTAQRRARSAHGPQDARLCGAPRRPMPYPWRFRSTTSNSPAAPFGSVFSSRQRSCLSRKGRRQD